MHLEAPKLTPGVVDSVLWLERARMVLLTGRRTELDGDVAAAHAHFTHALSLLPKDGRERWPVTELIRAGALAGLARISGDGEERRRAVAAFSNVPDELLGAADLADYAMALDEGDPAAAELLRRAASRGEAPAWASARLGRMEEAGGDSEAALAHFTRARLGAPWNAEYHEAWARVAVEHVPGRALAALRAAACLRAVAGDYVEALRLARDAVEFDGSDEPALLLLGDLLRATGNPYAARRVLKPVADAATPGTAMHACVTRALARSLAHDGLRQTALKRLGPLLGDADVTAYDLNLAGRIEGALGHVKKADARLEQAVALAPDRAEMVDDLVRHRLHQGELREAQEAIETAIELVADAGRVEPRLVVELGELRCRAGVAGSPAEEIERARLLGIRPADAWVMVAESRLRHGLYAAALEAYGAAIGYAPDDGRLHARRGELALERNLVEIAIEELERAARLSPGDPSIKLRLGEAYFRSGDSDRSRREIDAAVEMAHGTPLRARLLGTRGILRRSDEPHLARGDLVTSIEDDPTLGWPVAELLLLVAEEEGLDAAVAEVQALLTGVQSATSAVLRAAAELNDQGHAAHTVALVDAWTASDAWTSEDRVGLLLAQAQAYERLDDRAKAVERLEEALALQSANATVLAELAVQFAWLDHPEDAISMADRARRADPGSADVAIRCTRAIELAEGHAAALAEVERAREQIGEEPGLMMCEADLLLEIGRPEQALEIVRRLRSRWPTLDVNRTEGVAHARLGDPARARRLLEDAVRSDPSDDVACAHLAGVLLALGDPVAVLDMLDDRGDEARTVELGVYHAMALAANGDGDAALDELAAIVAARGELEWPRMQLVLIGLEHGREALAGEHLDVLLERDDLADDLRVMRLARDTGRVDVALDRLEALLARDPGDPSALLLRGEIHVEADDLDAAVADLSAALLRKDELSPDERVTLRLRLSRSYLSLNRLHDALESLGSSTDDRIAVRRAGVLFALGQAGAAMEVLHAVVASATGLDGAGRVESVIDLLIWESRFEEAALLLHDAFGATPALVDAIGRATGELLSGVGEFQRAVLVLERAALRDPAPPGVFGELAWAYLNLDDAPNDRLCHAIVRALDERPESPWLISMRADVHVRMGEHQAARALYEKIMDQYLHTVRSPRMQHSLAGWCRLRARDFDRAIDHFQRATSIEGGRPSGNRLDLGLALLAAGHHAMAIDEYRRAIEELRASASELARRGLLSVGLADLHDAVRDGYVDARADVEAIDSLLREDIDACGPGLERIEAFLERFVIPGDLRASGQASPESRSAS